MNLKIKDIINITKGKLLIGNKEAECEDFSRDTRTIKNGDTYVAIKGKNFDGNNFWEEAFNKGAETIIINEINIEKEKLEKYNSKNIIQVKDTKIALKQIAKAKRELYKDLIVIGVTGSVGKTSTKDIIANVLSQKYKTLKTEGNNNNDIGLPFTILKLKDHQVAVIEMGMNHLGEISELTQIAKPTIAVITNIGTSHIGNLGSRENILKAKLEILEGMENPIVVINNDNDLLHNWYENNRGKLEIHTFGLQNEAECFAENIEKNENSSKFICNINESEFGKNKKIGLVLDKKNEDKFIENVPVGGDVFILNSLCASLVGKLAGLDNSEIQNGISSFELTKKRMEIIELKNGAKIINDSYNASLESMKASIEYLANTDSKRKIAVLGDMFELGDFAEELHRKVGKEVVTNNINKLFVLGENAKFIADEAINDGFDKNNVLYANSTEELLQVLKEQLKAGDMVLFKASNGMRLFDIVEELKKSV